MGKAHNFCLSHAPGLFPQLLSAGAHQDDRGGDHQNGTGHTVHPSTIVQIASDELAEAITSLPAEKRNIILLSYFLEMTDMEIAELLNMVRSSVAYRRTATLKLLKELMGGKTDDS